MEDNLDKFEENTALFDAFIRGEMPPEQRADFEARLATDPALRSDFDLHRALLGSMARNWERERLRGQVKEARQAARDQGNNAGGGQHNNRFLLPLAAFFLLLVVGGGIWFFWPEPQPPSPPKPDNPRPQASNEQPSNVLSGANKESAYEIAAQAIRIVEGQPLRSTGTIYLIRILETPENEIVAITESTRIRLFFPSGRTPAKNQLGLIELDLEGKKSLYLKTGTQYFELRKTEGKQELTPVSDPALQAWLK